MTGKWVRCISDYRDDFRGRSEREIQLASQELRQRNRRHGQQFNITQKQLALFLRSADAKEVLLMQQLHDSEVKSVLATINGDRAVGETVEDNPHDPGQVIDEKRPSSVLDAEVELQKRERNLKMYEDY